MAGAGGKRAATAVACLLVIVGAGVWLVRGMSRGPKHTPPAQHLWVCSKCGEEFRAPLPPRELEERPMNLAELLGVPGKCPKCGGTAYCRPMVTCRTCGTSYAATIAVKASGKHVNFRCANGACRRPVLTGQPLPEEKRTAGKSYKCRSCGRTIRVLEMGTAKEASLTCPYADHGRSRLKPAE